MNICTDAANMHSFRIRIKKTDIALIDGYVGPGYGITYPEEIALIRDTARLGLILDHVYTGKAFYGMLQNIKRKKYSRVLFIQTGGLYSIFAYNSELSRKLQEY